MKKFLGLMGIFLFLAGCSATPLHQFFVSDYSGEPKIHLAVSDVIVQSNAPRFDKLPHIEYKMPISPEQALTKWANNRFNPVSMSSPITFKIVITEASMTQMDKPTTHWYTYDNVSYRLKYSITLLFMKNGAVVQEQKINGWEQSDIPQKSTLSDKEKTWEKMLNAMVEKVNDKVERDIPAEFRA